MSDDEAIALRVTMIGGQRYPDDFTVIWRCLPIGRTMQASGLPLTCRNGVGRVAWSQIRAALTDADIAKAHEMRR